MTEHDRMGQPIEDPTLLLIIGAARIINKGISTRSADDPLTVLLGKLRELESLQAHNIGQAEYIDTLEQRVGAFELQTKALEQGVSQLHGKLRAFEPHDDFADMKRQAEHDRRDRDRFLTQLQEVREWYAALPPGGMEGSDWGPLRRILERDADAEAADANRQESCAEELEALVKP